MEESPRRPYSFDEFTLDLSRARLLRGSEQIALRPKAFDALAYLVEHRGRVATKDELMRALWPKVVVTDDSLVKCIQEVRSALGDDGHRYIKTVARRGYLFDAEVVTDEPPQALQHAHETLNIAAASVETQAAETPASLGERAPERDGAAPVDAAHRAEPHDRRTRRRTGRIAWLGSAAAVVLLTILGAQYLTGRRADERPQAPLASVAVLPFVSISSDADQDYFSDGISEELMNVIANIPGLHVPSRTSSFAFKGTNTDLRSIAAALNVEHVLEGSVRKAGNQVRVTAQLIDVATDSQLWSASYDRELTNIFGIQDEIAQSVAGALRIELVGGELPRGSHSRTENLEAHDAYLRGLHYFRTQRSEDIFQAQASFRRAAELEPSYAAAYAELAASVLSAQGYGLMNRDEALAQAEGAIARALALDPELSDAHFANGRLLMVRGNHSGADAAYRRAIELNPSLPSAYFGRLYTLARLNRLDEARAALERALELDPLDALLNWTMGNVQLAQGDVVTAGAYYRRAMEFAPSQPNAYAGLGDVAILSGHLDEGLRWYLEGTEQDAGHAHLTSIVGLLYNSLGDPERAKIWFDRAANLYQAGSLAHFFRDFGSLVVRREDPDALLTVLRDIPAGQFEPLGSRLFRKAALQTGKTAEIEEFYRQNWPELFRAEPLVGANNFAVASDVAWLSAARGEADAAATLLTRALEVLRDPSLRGIEPPDWGAAMVETELLALQGRSGEALAALRRAIDSGWRWDWWQVETDPTLASIRSEPEFAALLAEVKIDLAAQLERVREMERGGQLDGTSAPASVAQ